MLELLSPARDLEVGKSAIDCGADAVYIGAPQFSARHAAGNSVEDIAALCRYAHRFGAKVLVALNTILTDEELTKAHRIIWQMYDVGVDALIVQDMGLLTLDLPPIRLHASTQCDNRTPQKIRFLEQAGFKRVVLARELSLRQIREIRRQTTVELEAFVHGALCVCYSGQCYLSQALMARSANRGECAQMCRQRYNLLDKDGKVIMHDKHLLSLRDMDRSAYVKQLEDAGVTTLKIEGRLKDADYVKNITAYYRGIIDSLGTGRTSWGRTALSFTPNPQKTFYRGATPYFIDGSREANMANFETPKSIGEYVGKVMSVGKDICVEAVTELHNGDGFVAGIDCPNAFVSPVSAGTQTARLHQDASVSLGGAVGFRASEVKPITTQNGQQAYRITCQPMPPLTAETRVFRNHDIEFQRAVNAPGSAVRLLPLCFSLSVRNGELVLAARQPDSGAQAEVSMSILPQAANNQERMASLLREQLSKLGGTCFYAERVEINTDEIPFLRTSEINALRREAVERIAAEHERLCTAQSGIASATNSTNSTNSIAASPTSAVGQLIEPFNISDAKPAVVADYRANVHNMAAKKWYAERGVEITEPAFEDQHRQGAELMRCKYCLRHELGMCLKSDYKLENFVDGPLFITTAGRKLKLLFDCQNCEMVVRQ